MYRSKALIALALILFLTSQGSAQSFEIRDDGCKGNELNFFSLADREGGNIGQPGYFDYQLCGSGVEEVEIAESCGTNLNSMLSIYQENDSHVSVYESFRLNVCTSFPASVNNSCSTGNRIVSLAKKDDSHVAEPGELQYQLCGQSREVETVTVEMKFDADRVYIDGEEAEERSYSSDELDYPYIVSDQPAGIVSYNDVRTVNYTTDGTTDVMKITQEEGSFLIPNTKGSYTELEDQQEAVLDRDLLTQFNPSFAFTAPEQPTIKVIYDPDVDLQGFERELRNSFELYVRHRVDDDPGADIEIGPT
ncbi:hypothetical protein GLU60_00880 [Nanohaloarchaea archaeon H01]|nr:hypothetical protein [Nanohaloarchaea archaeon H01]